MTFDIYYMANTVLGNWHIYCLFNAPNKSVRWVLFSYFFRWIHWVYQVLFKARDCESYYKEIIMELTLSIWRELVSQLVHFPYNPETLSAAALVNVYSALVCMDLGVGACELGKPWVWSQRLGFQFQLVCVLINCVPTLARLLNIFQHQFLHLWTGENTQIKG